MKHLNLIPALAAALLLGGAAPQALAKKNVTEIASTISDESVIFPESFETDTNRLLEGWYLKNYTTVGDGTTLKNDPGATDQQYMERLANLPTIIEMPYNDLVKKCIERYTKKGRPLVSAQLGLANYYMPIFEQALEQEGLPLELKYLPVIESALDPTATSRSGAAGLWQFVLIAAKGYDMEVNSLVDERRDPYISSNRAARLLKDLHDTYGDWSLAIAAYNCGPGTVNKALRRAGGDPADHNFWTIYNYLPSETRSYFPMFIAANYVMNHYKDHGISPVLPTRPLVTDTVGVTKRVHFDQITNVLNIPMDELRVLNPQFRADIIPGTPAKPYYLILPNQQIHAYILSEDAILAYNAEQYARHLTAEPGGVLQDADNIAAYGDGDETEGTFRDMVAATSPDDKPAEEEAWQPAQTSQPKAAAQPAGSVVMHKVGAEETLASIAKLYGVDPSEIKEWNSLRRNSVRTGQQLKIYTPGAPASAAVVQAKPAAKADQPQAAATAKASASKAAPAKSTASKSTPARKKKTQAAQPKNHDIKNGENLTTIAKKYGVTVDELKKANNMKSDAIRAGKTLKIPAKKSSSASSKKSKKRRR